jgi:hypothetical protein
MRSLLVVGHHPPERTTKPCRSKPHTADRFCLLRKHPGLQVHAGHSSTVYHGTSPVSSLLLPIERQGRRSIAILSKGTMNSTQPVANLNSDSCIGSIYRNPWFIKSPRDETKQEKKILYLTVQACCSGNTALPHTNS